METLERLAPLLGGILVFVTAVLILLSATNDAFVQWREEEKRARRAWLEEKRDTPCK